MVTPQWPYSSSQCSTVPRLLLLEVRPPGQWWESPQLQLRVALDNLGNREREQEELIIPATEGGSHQKRKPDTEYGLSLKNESKENWLTHEN